MKNEIFVAIAVGVLANILSTLLITVVKLLAVVRNRRKADRKAE